MRGQRPQHLAVVADVDVAVHRDHGFQVRVPAEQGEHDLPRLAVAALLQGHVAMKMGAGIGVVHGGDGGETRLEFLAHFRFPGQPRQGQVFGVATADHVHQPGVLAPHQGVDPQHIVGRAVRGIAAEFTERAFFGVGRRVDGAFQHKLGEGRHADAIAGRLDQLQRLAKQTAGHRAFVAAEGQACRRGEHEQRMRANHHGHAQLLATLAGGLQHAPQVTARVQAGGEGLPGVAHRAVIAHVGDAGDRVLRNDDRVGDVGAAVAGEMLEHRQQCEVHGFAFEDFIQHRAGFHVARGDGVVGAVLESLVQLRRGHAEHPGDAGPGGEQVGDHRRAEVADFFADQQRVATLGGESIDQGGDVLIGAKGLRDGEHIVRVLPAIGV
ncbi:hypothetical protein D3C76_860390 [compost metagenome]